MDAQQARCLGKTSLRFSQRTKNQISFGLVEDIVISRHNEPSGPLLEWATGEVFRQNLIGQAEDDGVFDCILEFADIPWPAVAHQELTGLV